MSEKENIVITGMARTPMGAFQGTLKDASCAELGAASIRAALERSRVGADEVSETIMGCVLPAGQGQAPARQAALGAEMPLSVCCTTVNKMCGSGMKSAMLAHDLLLGGEERILVAGGMESMTNAPYLLPRARSGMRLGHGEVVDHMFLDGLEDAYDRGKLMGTFAEATAGRYGFSREAQDEFAIRSLTRAKKAIAGFKIRQGMPIGCAVTLRGDRMYAFLERLINLALPRIRDFRGVSPKSFDGRGNYTLGVREQIIFPEISFDKIDAIRGMDITIVTTARSDEEGRALLREMGMPFQSN